MKEKDLSYIEVVRFLGSDAASYRAPAPHPIDGRDHGANTPDNWRITPEYTMVSRCQAGITLGRILSQNTYSHEETKNLLQLSAFHYCAKAQGAVLVTLNQGPLGRAFEQSYLPELLANEDITTINGIPRKIVAALYATRNRCQTPAQQAEVSARLAQSLAQGFIVDGAVAPKVPPIASAIALIENEVKKRYGPAIRDLTSKRSALLQESARLVKTAETAEARALTLGKKRYLPHHYLKRVQERAAFDIALTKIAKELGAIELRQTELSRQAASPASLDALLQGMGQRGEHIRVTFGANTKETLKEVLSATFARVTAEQEYRVRRLPPASHKFALRM